MSAVHGRKTAVYVNAFDLSLQLNKHTLTIGANEHDVTTFQAGARRYIGGLPDGSLSLEGFFEQDPELLNKTDDVFQSLTASGLPAIVTVAPEGSDAVGLRAILADSVETKAEVSSPADGPVLAMADFRGPLNSGVILAPLAEVSATGNGTAHDNGAATSNGAVAHQHVTAAGGTDPTNTTIVQHSADGVTYADLITFTEKTEAGSERATATGTVNRYTRVRRVVGGTTPTFTQAVALARL